MDTAQLLRDSLMQSGFVDITSAGSSMFPFIRDRNRCRFERIAHHRFSASGLQLGDVVLFAVGNRLIGHRLHRVERTGNRVMLICKGDSNVQYDRVVPFEAVIGKLVYIKGRRGGVQTDSWLSRGWRSIILRFPSSYTRFAIWCLRVHRRYQRLLQMFGRSSG